MEAAGDVLENAIQVARFDAGSHLADLALDLLAIAFPEEQREKIGEQAHQAEEKNCYAGPERNVPPPGPPPKVAAGQGNNAQKDDQNIEVIGQPALHSLEIGRAHV